jgi:hypothetical protein
MRLLAAAAAAYDHRHPRFYFVETVDNEMGELFSVYASVLSSLIEPKITDRQNVEKIQIVYVLENIDIAN